MKTAIFTLAATLLASASAKYTTSKPFYLVLVSDEHKYNGSSLAPIHEGAGIEGLSPSNATGKDATSYTFKYFQGTSSSKALGPLGNLQYKLVTGSGAETEQLSLYLDPSTNVALALFEPADGAEVAFDKHGLLNLQSGLKDTVTPPTDSKARGLYRWFICESNYSGYVYATLNWVYGVAKPQNPSCVATQVKRVFV